MFWRTFAFNVWVPHPNDNIFDASKVDSLAHAVMRDVAQRRGKPC